MTELGAQEEPWQTQEAVATLAALQVDGTRGLMPDEVRARLERYGPNLIRAQEVAPWWRILLHQFTDPLIYLLLAATAVSLLLTEYVDAAVIMAAVLLNATVGFTQELRARQAILSLSAMSAPKARVLRDGRTRDIPTEEVVPGDIVVLAAGARVPADVRLFEVHQLDADESALTGESVPVTKQTAPVADERAVPGDQLSMAFAGTTITRGSGRGVVVRTGERTELGRIAQATRIVGATAAPIEEKMAFLGKAIAAGILILSLAIIAIGVTLGMHFTELVHAMVAMAVGAVPEGLPVVLTVTLAVGVQRMARRNVIIRSLRSVETLGSTTVVGSDKTGTLTANRMTVRVVWSGGRRYDVTGQGVAGEGESRAVAADGGPALGEPVHLTLLAGVLANEAETLPLGEGGDAAGDPTELALLAAAAKLGLDPAGVRRAHRQLDIVPFASEQQLMATLNETAEGRSIFVKGSPEAVLQRCSRQLGHHGEEEDLDRDRHLQAAGALADEGYRVLAFAFRPTDARSLDGVPSGELVFAGLQGMEDPVRPEAVEAVRLTRRAGVRVMMLTGDHARTARAIGAQLGLGRAGRARVVEGRELSTMPPSELDRVVREVDVYARVSPEHKLTLVQRLKEQGHVVAVTGDGINDAPALRAAHLGIAMGRSGTDVAREASDMVLADDNFASITRAIEEGRIVFNNIRKVTYFLLSTGVGMVLAIVATLFGPWPLVFLPAQVLWINLVTNGVQDVALAFEKGEPGLLNRPPRPPGEGVLNSMVLWRLVWVGLFVAVATMAVYLWMLWRGDPVELARSVAMTQMVLFQFFHVLNARSFHRSILAVPLRANPFLAISLPITLLAHLGALYLPFMQAIFDTRPLELQHWALVVAVGALIIIAAEIDKAFLRRREAPKGTEGA